MQTRRPEPGPALYQGFFVESKDPIATMGQGVQHLIHNARRLYEDAKTLAEANRPVSAEFLLTTAKEEIGKVFILLDMIKLDFMKHESTLRRLCRAFYNHGIKLAYTTLNTAYALGDLKEAKQAFIDTAASWMPEEEESGVPDMPNLWVMEREWRLYVDYVEQDSQWFVPAEFDKDGWGTKTELGYVESCIQQAEEALEKGNFEREVLVAYHIAFSKHYFTEASPDWELTKAVYDFLGIAEQKDVRFWTLHERSFLLSWPLYAFA